MSLKHPIDRSIGTQGKPKFLSRRTESRRTIANFLRQMGHGPRNTRVLKCPRPLVKLIGDVEKYADYRTNYEDPAHTRRRHDNATGIARRPEIPLCWQRWIPLRNNIIAGAPCYSSTITKPSGDKDQQPLSDDDPFSSPKLRSFLKGLVVLPFLAPTSLAARPAIVYRDEITRAERGCLKGLHTP